MNKRGIALILCFMVIAVLAIMGVGLISRSISGSNIVQRYVNSTRAFWLAEAGVAEAIVNLPLAVSGDLGDSNNTYSTTISSDAGIHTITSTGEIILSSGSTITRTIEVIVQGFQFGTISSAIATGGDLTIKGSATVDGETESGIELSFEDIFGMTEAELRALADHLYIDPANNIQPVDGITWIDISSGQLLIADTGWEGSGILVINGDVQITGGDFDGILWITGILDMTITGNPDIAGAIFVDSADPTTITGQAEIVYDIDAIGDAFDTISPEVLSWSEL